jgi:cell division protease FtsH
MAEFEEAVERIVAGLEIKNRLINPKEIKIVAYRELGHAIVAMTLPDGLGPGLQFRSILGG